jgi:hypothetical protein
MGGDRSSRRCRRWLFQANPTHLAGHLLRSPHKTRSQRRIQGQGAALVLIIFDPYFLVQLLQLYADSVARNEKIEMIIAETI